MWGLSCAKLRLDYTGYPLVFGQLAYDEAFYHPQLYLLKLHAAEKELSQVWVIKSTDNKKYKLELGWGQPKLC